MRTLLWTETVHTPVSPRETYYEDVVDFAGAESRLTHFGLADAVSLQICRTHHALELPALPLAITESQPVGRLFSGDRRTQLKTRGRTICLCVLHLFLWYRSQA